MSRPQTFGMTLVKQDMWDQKRKLKV